MKRIQKILTALLLITCTAVPVIAMELCPNEVRVAINKYKAEDYIGCIQDIEEYTQNDPSNAVAYYYAGIAYMQVGLKDKAIEAFEKVSTINSVPQLSSYAIQASNCMTNDVDPCVYKNFSATQIDELVANPKTFFENLNAEPQKAAEVKIEATTDIDKLIQGQFPQGIHPDANKVIQETRLKQEQERVNSELNQKTKTQPQKNKTDATLDKPERIATAELSDKEIADAVRTLNKAGYQFVAPNQQPVTKNPMPYQQMATQYAMNDEAAQMAMMFGDNSNKRQDSFTAMLPYLMNQENPDGTKQKLSPEVIKTMMMSQMMGDFDFGFDNDKDN